MQRHAESTQSVTQSPYRCVQCLQLESLFLNSSSTRALNARSMGVSAVWPCGRKCLLSTTGLRVLSALANAHADLTSSFSEIAALKTDLLTRPKRTRYPKTKQPLQNSAGSQRSEIPAHFFRFKAGKGSRALTNRNQKQPRKKHRT
jgi:hypothetical protein